MWDAVASAKSVPGLAVRDGVYEWRQMIAGKRYHESLRIPVGTRADEAAAIKLLRGKQRAVAEGRAGDAQEFRRGEKVATIGQALEILEQYGAAAGSTARTVRDYGAALRMIVAAGLGRDRAGVDALPLSVLTAELVERYERAVLAAAGNDPAAAQAARNTVVSVRRKARAVFSRRARSRMRGLVLPAALDEFLRAGDVREQIDWSLPDPDLVRRTKAAALELRDERSDLWLAWLLCYGLALRAGEAAAARYSWLRVAADGSTVLDVVARPGEWDGPKGTPGFVPLPGGVLAELERLREGRPYILPGATHQARYWLLIMRDFSGWMRGLGWTTNHCAHELRRLRGSEWWTDGNVGPVVCSAWLRHSSLAVTQRHYAKLTQHPTAPEIF